MVSEHMKLTSFEEMSEMTDGAVDSKKIMVKCAASIAAQLVIAFERSRTVDTIDHPGIAGELLQWRCLMHPL